MVCLLFSPKHSHKSIKVQFLFFVASLKRTTKKYAMFGSSAIFDDGNSMTTDAWTDRSRSKVSDYEEHSIVARTLLPTVEKKKKQTVTPPSLAVAQDSQTDYGDSYPNTNTNKIDWALLAAHRVGNVLGIKLQDSKKSVIAERNLATIFFAKCNGEKFKDDQRSRIIENLTLESILLAIFLPLELSRHLQSFASQHAHLRLASRQCTAQIEQNQQSLQSRGARERDLLIKRLLFYADNGKTECPYAIDAKEFGQHANDYWSEKTLESVREPDLFGRAIGVLVHDVLQSPSLRVRAGPTVEKNTISLILSWSNALDNIKEKTEEVERRDKQSTFAPPPPPPLAKKAIAHPLFEEQEEEKQEEEKPEFF